MHQVFQGYRSVLKVLWHLFAQYHQQHQWYLLLLLVPSYLVHQVYRGDLLVHPAQDCLRDLRHQDLLSLHQFQGSLQDRPVPPLQ